MNNAGRYPSNVASFRPPGATDALGGDGDTGRVVDVGQRAAELMPSELAVDEAVVWQRTCRELLSVGRMKPLYVDGLAEYCRIVARMARTRVELGKDWTYRTTGRHGTQHKAKPEVAQLNDDFRKFTQMVAHFGLSPATEMRYVAGKQSELFGNEFSDLG